MLVVMHAAAQQEQLESVCDAGKNAGLSPTVFAGDPTMVLLSGTPLADIEPQLLGMAAVARVLDPVDAASPTTSNLRISGIRPLISPAILMEQLPMTAQGRVLVQESRRAIRQYPPWARRSVARRHRPLLDSRCGCRARLCRPAGGNRAGALR
ncbi:MAG: hypothetical protein M9947_17485 [Thermomicrobiales bacterium]|nr:hypothetical protein [Thermomicrobiales bacterium]